MERKTRITAVLGVSLVLIMPASILAESSQTQEAGAMEKQKAVLHSIDGEIATVDVPAKTITVKAKDSRERRLTVGAFVDESTLIKEGKMGEDSAGSEGRTTSAAQVRARRTWRLGP